MRRFAAGRPILGRQIGPAQIGPLRRPLAVQAGLGYCAAMSDPVRFIHLRTHTEYSLLEGAVPVKKLVGLCAAQSMPAVAVTDSNAMFAALEFSTLAAGAGVPSRLRRV